MFDNFLRKAFKLDKMVIKKTDSELVRYMKQTTMIEERKRYEDLMKKEAERKNKGLNDQEKRLVYFQTIDSLDRKVYNKPLINDEDLNTYYLYDKKNYRPLG